ncbi:MAG: bifunctional 4-hydroxy-2-oxoglutarate aldolase/2-dehydro-3-deoxy-phosphogluconate aldolase [Pontimonas sp.]|nr:bifunctional 4-hydroxy-2-oxoglutarate aldolase/2-dehydro-3-deoxy-phosphogluconate aldolase [Pontimonas sp.]
MLLRTVAILRSYDPERSQALALQCWSVGMDLVEVPVQGERGWAALAAVAAIAGGRPFGAGTLLTPADTRRAADLGASVAISPGIDDDMVRAAIAAGMEPLPGVFTASDLTLASRLGVTTAKLFPASLAGPQWLGAMRGPFPGMRFVAVGGIDMANAAEFLQAGASGVGFGSSVEDILAASDPKAVVASLHALCD